jgi:hypothetical protein
MHVRFYLAAIEFQKIGWGEVVELGPKKLLKDIVMHGVPHFHEELTRFTPHPEHRGTGNRKTART